MQAVDDYMPTPERAVDQPFLMPIEDVFGIKGRGTVVTGRIERGLVKTGDEIEIVGLGERRKVVVTGVEMFQKTLDDGRGGRQCRAACCAGWSGPRSSGGRCLCKPGSINPHTKVAGRGLRAEQGGGGAAHAVLQRATGRSSTFAPPT